MSVMWPVLMVGGRFPRRCSQGTEAREKQHLWPLVAKKLGAADPSPRCWGKVAPGSVNVCRAVNCAAITPPEGSTPETGQQARKPTLATGDRGRKYRQKPGTRMVQS